jgi:HD-GYP domain-containing protein (c-di-GMP phosphodiesterase class II)
VRLLFHLNAKAFELSAYVSVIYYIKEPILSIKDFSYYYTQLSKIGILLVITYEDILFILKKLSIIKSNFTGLNGLIKIITEPESKEEKIILSKHSISVGDISDKIAYFMGEKRSEIKTTGYLHDLGKIFIPTSLLFSDKKLNRDEITIFQQHVRWGEFLLKQLFSGEKFKAIFEGISFHHERLNGSGYIKGIQKIPDIAKIIAVADTYTSLTSSLNSKEILPSDVAITYISAKEKELFDPEIVNVFKKIIL